MTNTFTFAFRTGVGVQEGPPSEDAIGAESSEEGRLRGYEVKHTRQRKGPGAGGLF